MARHKHYRRRSNPSGSDLTTVVLVGAGGYLALAYFNSWWPFGSTGAATSLLTVPPSTSVTPTGQQITSSQSAASAPGAAPSQLASPTPSTSGGGPPMPPGTVTTTGLFPASVVNPSGSNAASIISQLGLQLAPSVASELSTNPTMAQNMLNNLVQQNPGLFTYDSIGNVTGVCPTVFTSGASCPVPSGMSGWKRYRGF